MVVPRADPPVGTRGRPFRDLFFSGIVGRSQVPGLAIVLENGRREIEAPFFEKTALFEDAVVDTRSGAFVNNDLAGYHVPVHADIPAVEAIMRDVGRPLGLDLLGAAMLVIAVPLTAMTVRGQLKFQ